MMREYILSAISNFISKLSSYINHNYYLIVYIFKISIPLKRISQFCIKNYEFLLFYLETLSKIRNL